MRYPKLSFLGLLLAIIYILWAFPIARDTIACSGGFINLCGVTIFIATFPVAFLADIMGIKLNTDSLLQMGIYIGLCAILIYLLGIAMEKGVTLILAIAKRKRV